MIPQKSLTATLGWTTTAMLVFAAIAALDWVGYDHSLLGSFELTQQLSLHTALLTAMTCLTILSKRVRHKMYLLWAGLLYCALLTSKDFQTWLNLGTASTLTITAFFSIFIGALANIKFRRLNQSLFTFLLFSWVQTVGFVGIVYAVQTSSIRPHFLGLPHLASGTAILISICSILVYLQTAFDFFDPKTRINQARQIFAFGLCAMPLLMVVLLYLVSQVLIDQVDNYSLEPVYLGVCYFAASVFLFVFGTYAGRKEEETANKLASQKAELDKIHNAQIEQAEKELGLTKERLELAFKGAQDGLWDWEVSSNVIYLSPSHDQMLGYTSGTLSPTLDMWKALLHPDDQKTAQMELERVIKDRSCFQFSQSFRLKHKNGDWIPVLSRGLILRDSQGKAIRMAGTHINRKEIIELQKELSEASILAQTEIKANEQKSKFLALVSHEIRNPLNALCGFARLVKDESQEAEIRQYAGELLNTANHLAIMLNDLLDFAKIDANKMAVHPEICNVKRLSKQIADNWKVLCEEKHLTFQLVQSFPLGCFFWIDGLRLHQIIQNLIANAIKFTPKGSVHLSIQATGDNLANQSLIIEVSDTGMGITPDKMPQLFKPFSQVHEENRSELGGTGLGLSIVKSLTELMNGKVSCSSTPGQGSVFRVELPVEGCDESRHEGTQPHNLRKHSRHVLCADDSPVNLKILSKFLVNQGHTVQTAANGEVAAHLLATQKFDFALLDMDMPVHSGLELLQMCKSTGSLNITTSFACLSGHASKTDIDLALTSGFDKYFTKPIDFDQLIDYLEH